MLIEQKNKDIEKQLQVFGFGKIQDFITMFNVMKLNNITINDVREYIEYIKKMTKEKAAKIKLAQEAWVKKAKKCPECNTPMQLTQGDDNDSIWACMKCRFSIYNKQNVKEILKELGVKV